MREFMLERERHFAHPHHQYDIELHWCLTTREFPRALDTTGLFARSRKVLVHGQPLSTLSDTDIALHLCHHGTQHRWAKLRYLVDFSTALSLGDTSGWDALLKAAQEQGLYRPMLVAAHLCHEFLGSDLPEKAGNLNSLERWAVKLARSNIIASSADSETEIVGVIFMIVIAEKDRYQPLLHALKTMFTPTIHDYQWIKLPNSLRWLYPVLKPFRRAWKSLAVICGCRKSSSNSI